MATLSKHGRELLRLEYVSATVSYREDGKILRNAGNGWKLFKSVKPGVDVAEHCAKVRENRAQKDTACPTFARLRKILAQYGPSVRWVIYHTFELMPTDPDGVWSTCDDHGFSVDIDDLVDISRLWEAAHAELRGYNAGVKRAQAVAPGSVSNWELNKP